MSNTARLRVRSDGTFHGTHVEAEDGRRVHGVRSVSWWVSAEEPEAHCVVDLVAPVRLEGNGTLGHAVEEPAD